MVLPSISTGSFPATSFRDRSQTVDTKNLYAAKRVVENQTGICVEGYLRAEEYITVIGHDG